MKKNDIPNVRSGAAAIGLLIFLAVNPSGLPSQELMTQKVLPLDVALLIAQGALEQCRADGSHVSVTVVDGTGQIKVFVRDDLSGLHTIDLSQRKAYTAFTYQRTSGEQARYWASLPPPAFSVKGTVGLPGGVPIRTGTEVIGAVGVSGSAEPSPGKDLGVVTGNADEKCAMAGLSKVANKLK